PNEIIISTQDNNDYDTLSEESSPNQLKKKCHGGPKRDLVWDYIDISNHLEVWHYGASCRHCLLAWNYEKLQILKQH
ncbi:18718_t:CDS:1, partial [Dentiscutata erythropus]